MGYMGFGMRKADYTRKPKSAFEKRKTLDKMDAKSRKVFKTNTQDQKKFHLYMQGKYKLDRSKMVSRIYWLFLLAVILIVIIKVLNS